MRRRLARIALGLYPLAFRRRYGPEMEALLDEGPPRASTVLDLLRGAAVAHVRPRGAVAGLVGAGDRVRASASGVLACWVAFSAAGFGFYQATEDHPSIVAGDAHPVLGAAHVSVQALAVFGSAAVALGALPLILAALLAARREAGLRAWTAVPPAAVAAFVLVTGVLVAIARAHHAHGPTVGSGIALAAWELTGLACGAACVVGAREALFRLRVPRWQLLAAFGGAALATAAMAAITVAVAVYAVALPIDAARLAVAPNGPLQALSESASLVVQAVVMAIAATLALTSTRRGWAAANRLRAAGAPGS